MASTIEAMDAILSPMISRYSAPRGMEDPATTIKEYAEDLGQFTRVELEDGWKHLRQHHARATWPHFSEILESIRASRPERQAKPLIYSKDDTAERDGWYDRAGDAPAYPLAVQAGVPLTFRNMARADKRFPGPGDIGECKRRWNEHLQRVEEIERSEGRFKHILVNLGHAMISRNEELIASPFPPEAQES